MPVRNGVGVTVNRGYPGYAGSAAGPTVYFLDTFTEASPPVDILVHVPDIGPMWQAAGSEFYRVIAGNLIEQQFGVDGFIFVDSGVSDCVIRFTADQFAWGVLFRYTDTNNWYRAALQNTGQIDIQKREAGVDSVVGGLVGLSLTPPCVIKVTLSGNDITMEIEGVPGTTVMVTDSFNATATRHGLRTDQAGHTGDDYSIQSA